MMNQIKSGCITILFIVGIIYAVCLLIFVSPIGSDIKDDPVYADVFVSRNSWGIFILQLDELQKRYWIEAGWKFNEESSMPHQKDGWLCMPSISGTWYKIQERDGYVGCCFQGAATGCSDLLVNSLYGYYEGKVIDAPWWALQQATTDSP